LSHRFSVDAALLSGTSLIDENPMGTQAGFSLVELIVAMLITVIVSGAIYGLIVSGQSAFRREPELSQRQENIRLAMSVIQTDVMNGGAGLDPFAQVFRDGQNNTGPPAFPSVIYPGSGQVSDKLEILANDGTCPSLQQCDTPGVNFKSKDEMPSCFGLPGLVYIYGPGGAAASQSATPGLRYAILRGGGGGGSGSCGGAGGQAGSHSNMPQGSAPGYNPPGNNCDAATCQFMTRIQDVVYEIWADPIDGTPALWRDANGGRDTGGALVAPGTVGSTWQLIARGIEDMQVQYLPGNQYAALWNQPQNWPVTPGTVNPGACTTYPTCPQAAYETIIRQVEVTLSARALAPRLQGEITIAGGAPAAVRGQLTTVMTPRTAQVTLSQPASGCSPPTACNFLPLWN